MGRVESKRALNDYAPIFEPGDSAELDLRGVALGGVFDLEELGILEAKHSGKDDGRKGLTFGVINHHTVVEGLAGERDFVLRGSKFFAELGHVLVGLQVGISFGNHHELGERPGKSGFSSHEVLDGLAVGGIGGGRFSSGGGDVTRFDDGFERFALVLEISLGRFDEIRNEVVATFELHVDLRECVFETVAQGDERIVDADDPEGDDDGNYEQNDEGDKEWTHNEGG